VEEVWELGLGEVILESGEVWELGLGEVILESGEVWELGLGEVIPESALGSDPGENKGLELRKETLEKTLESRSDYSGPEEKMKLVCRHKPYCRDLAFQIRYKI
jgi:hypothetical protein